MWASTSRRLPSQSVCQTSRSSVSRCSTRPGREASAASRSNSVRVRSTTAPSTRTSRLSSSTSSSASRRTDSSAAAAGAAAWACRGKRSIACTRATSSRGRERLGHVPVGADGQPDQQVDLLGAGGEHQDVALGLGADLAAHLGAVGVREAQVEHDQVGGVAADLLQAGRARSWPHGRRTRPSAAP